MPGLDYFHFFPRLPLVEKGEIQHNDSVSDILEIFIQGGDNTLRTCTLDAMEKIDGRLRKYAYDSR
jgi:hypothetical protein